TEEFKKEVYDLVGDEYTVVGEYTNAREKIKMRHENCKSGEDGYEYLVVPYSFIAGTRCPYCFKSKKKTTEEFKKEVYDLVGDEYTVIGKYINAREKIEMRHEDCGSEGRKHEYFVTPTDFLSSGNRCPNCFRSDRKTTEEFKKEILERFNGDYEVLGEYINAHTEIFVEHFCGNQFHVTPNTLMYYKSCPECSIEERRLKYSKTQKEFEEEVYKQVGNEYTVLGKYFNAKTKILMRHNSCDNEYKVTPDDFLNGEHRCPKCYRNKLKTTNQFNQELYEKYEGEYVLINKYKSSREKSVFIHECGYIWQTTPGRLLRGYGCPVCAGNKPRNTEEFKREVYDLVGDEYSVLGEYINADEKITFKHNVDSCDYVWETRPSVFKRGCRCPKCAGSLTKTTEEFKREVYDLVGNEYSVLGEYINTDTNVKMKHEVCEKIFYPNPYAFLNGTRCPGCSNSKIEKLFLDFLDELGLKDREDFFHNTTMPDCKFVRSLRFDFRIIGDKEYLIEFDGKFHYQNRISIDQLEIQMARDACKNKYCRDNNIELIRIPYWEFDNFKDLIDSHDINKLKSIILKGEFKSFLKEKLNIFDEYYPMK
ncbi:MAG: hypothetical protein ACOCZ5_02975, partial [bacterium]